VGKLPATLEWWLNTPSHHRVHHASNVPYRDRNYGGALIVWDRLFGTFAAETEAPVYGITRPVGSVNPLWLQVHEYVDIARDLRGARRWRDGLGYLLRGPGWAPAESR